ncbi:hypothetical protein AMATHDRAFT_64867 [Amanita thiersii Skay4041]|uniref:Major facilitator superfamily (MFS) profile domain-containing protein n=1 Tax=Amanita thiersii Skay4041 TaxID=703135 RepID=A0A2A9NDG3_9AGAR|nr:hypothetical protein AMATHDRAFT_64867 [Amanita thiersii Skay4041]
MGLGKVLVFGSSCQVVAYLLQAFALPFPVFIISFAIGSCGMALQDAQGNGYVAALKDHTKMGVLHAVYGLGAMVAPLISTQFAQLYHWSFYYFTSFGISIINTIFLFLVFRLEPQDVCLAKCGYATVEKGENETGTTNGIKEIMKTKAVHLVAVFILVYVGVEVTLGGWTVTYVIQVRGGGPSSGYVSTGFFGGLTLGRVALLFVTKKLGEHRALLLYAVLAIGLEFVVWFAPSLVGDAIALSFTGFFLGPMYPIAMNQCGRILPPWILTTSIGWIGAVGNTGSAIIPFMTGAISQRWGIWSLQPLIVIMMGIMTILWLLVPKKGSTAA